MVNHPTCKVLLACQSLVQHKITKEYHLTGVFKTFRAHHFPSHSRPFDIHAVITDWEGKCSPLRFTVMLVDESGSEPVFVSQPFMERMESRLEEREITAHVVQGIRLPRQGQYDLQLEFEDISIMRRPLTAILDHETPLGDDEPQKTA